ncbi:MAG: PCRF domain-containing protein, partial [Limnohabitans sp.]
MKPFMRAQLERSVQRLSELDFLLSREDIMQDMTQFMVLSREHAEVVALVTPYQKWLQHSADLEAAQAMLQDPDPEVQAMAQDELAHGSAGMATLEAQLQRMLLPKDPDDARNAFLEIRAGTGGDESALF